MNKLHLLRFTLLIKYCSLWYLAISNSLFGNVLAKASLLLVIVHSILYVYLHKDDKKLFVWLILYGIISFAYLICKRREVLDLYVYISFYADIDKYQLNDEIYKTSLLFLIFTIVLSVFNILPVSTDFYRDELRRYTFGFCHPNTAGQYLTIIASSAFVKYYNSRNIKALFVLIISFLVTYFICRSRTSSIIILIIIITFIIKMFKIDILKKVIGFKYTKYIISILAIAIIVSLLYISYNYKSFSIINRLLSYRIENNYLFLKHYSINIFGNGNLPTWLVLSENGVARYLDSGYMQLLLGFGMFNTIGFLIFVLYAVFINIKQHNEEIVLLLILVLLSLVVEAAPLRWYFSFSLLYICNNNYLCKETK